MNAHHQVNHQWNRKVNIVTTSLAFIVVGLLFIARNMGAIDNHVFHTLVSWQMLLVVIGAAQLFKRNILGGLILITIGTFFLLPTELGLAEFWPLLLIAIGVGMLFKLQKPSGHWPWQKHTSKNSIERTVTDNGFINSDVNFSGAKHIVLDPAFRGADLDCNFGSIVLDLRRTMLENENTYIDIDCNFGGIEIFIPSNWNVIIEVNCTLGGIDDKRLLSHEIDHVHKLILRGNIHFSGIELKS